MPAWSSQRLVALGVGIFVVGMIGLIPVVGPSSPRVAASATVEHLVPALPAAIARPLAGLPLLDVHGRAIGRELESAGVLVVHFWAGWCEPCQPSIVAHDAIAHRYAPSDVAVLAMAEDRRDGDVLAFLERHPLERVVVARDVGHETASVLRPSRMPSTFVIDRRGKTVHVLAGWRDRDTENLVREIDRMLRE